MDNNIAGFSTHLDEEVKSYSEDRASLVWTFILLNGTFWVSPTYSAHSPAPPP
jgi:hypothetical protein